MEETPHQVLTSQPDGHITAQYRQLRYSAETGQAVEEWDISSKHNFDVYIGYPPKRPGFPYAPHYSALDRRYHFSLSFYGNIVAVAECNHERLVLRGLDIG